MKCNELLTYWDEYVRASLIHSHNDIVKYPEFESISQLLKSYSGKDERAVETNMIVEPYLGDLRPENLACIKLVMLNLNPGPSRTEHQSLSKDSTFGSQLSFKTYSEWAATWPYLTLPICENWGGPFVRQRISYAEEITGDKISNNEVIAFEMFPWHSARWGKFDGKMALSALRELVFEPLVEIVESSNALLIAFGKPWQQFAETIGEVVIQNDLSVSTKTGRYKRRFVQYRLPNNLHLNILINAGYAGPPRSGHPDIAIIRDLIFGSEAVR